MPVTISKSQFMSGVQCLKRLYWQVHEPELGVFPDAAAVAIMEQGGAVGRLARQLFAGGVEVSSRDSEQAIRTTRELIANPEVPAIFEAAFEDGGVFVRVDILHRRRDNRWRLIEVKSTADLKEQHLDDLAIQHRVVSRSGLDLASSCLAHVNRNYVYTGGDIDVWRFFRIKNLTRRVERLLPKLTFQLRSELRVLAMPNPPEIPTGPHCTNPITCEFFDRCNAPLPNDHIGYLPRLHASAAEELEEMGVESILDIPEDYPLGDRQRRAATCVQTGEPWFDKESLKTELDALTYPLFFMDFETINPCVPRFAGMRPYDHIVFQFSVHVQREPGAKPEHYEFLAVNRDDPRREFITSLGAVLGQSGTVIVYNQSFELARLNELASWLQEFAEPIKQIQSRVLDLLPVIRNHVYHPAFAGSYSLKAVLPALLPEMTYEGMEIANGTDAGVAWEAFTKTTDQGEQQRIKKALSEYCALDTLALLRLVERLRSAFGQNTGSNL